jgi:hypothetical protein
LIQEVDDLEEYKDFDDQLTTIYKINQKQLLSDDDCDMQFD